MKCCNDPHFGSDGALDFTDQGQTGLQDPTGCVYLRHPETGVLTCLIDKVAIPNVLALNLIERVLYPAVTRANAWRLPLSSSGRPTRRRLWRTGKANAFHHGVGQRSILKSEFPEEL